MNKDFLMRLFTLAIAIVVLVAGSVFYVRYKRSVCEQAATQARIKLEKEKTDADALKLAQQRAEDERIQNETKAREKSWAETLTTATVGKGQGFEHSFAAQLIAKPTAFKKYKFKGDVNDKTAVKKWAQAQSDIIAKRMGIIDKYGAELRIPEPNKVAPVLTEDSEENLSVYMCVKDANSNFPSSPLQTFEVHNSFSQANFLAHVDDDGKISLPKTLATYAYAYAPGIGNIYAVSEI